MSNPSSSTKRALAAVAICGVAYLYVFPYYPAINNPNENVRFYMTAALVDDHSYIIDGPREQWGWVNDAAVRDGHHYSVKAPGTSFLGIPGYALYRAISGDSFDRTTALWVVRVTATVLPSLLFLFFFYCWLNECTRFGALRDAVFFSTALGSLLFGYSLLFTSHTQSAACAFGAFMLLSQSHRTREAKPWSMFIAGLLTAGVTLFEYPGVIVSFLLTLYALVAVRPKKQLAFFVLGALVPTLAMMHFQWRAFGNPLTPGHLMVENPAFRAGHEEGFFGASTFHLEGAWRLLVDLRLGLFSLTPIFLFAFVGFPRLLKNREERFDAAVALVICIAMYVAICFMNIWHAGWSIGPRYLAVLVPFIAWASLEGLNAIAQRLPAASIGLATGCTATAIVACGIASAYYPHLPPELDHPLADLFAVLIAHDYAPHNAANLIGLFGSMSMLPLALLGLFAIGWGLWSDRSQLPVGRALATTLVAFVLTIIPHVWSPPKTRPVLDAVAFITRTWSPEGHDVASRTRKKLLASHEVDPDAWRHLADIYFEEGRDNEARAVTRRMGH